MQTKRIFHSLFIFFLCITLTAVLALPAGAAAEDRVLLLEITGAITPASDNLIADAIEEAESGNFEVLVITLDTPGGGLEETQTIIKLIENTTVPVIGYVPESGKAWSAGTLILMGTDIAAMAPFTVIGSAQPVRVSAEGTVPVEDEKVINASLNFRLKRQENTGEMKLLQKK